jgi:predicted Zn-dependent protease with MMP-like domain
MVGVAQLVERWLVVPEVAGSSPVVHPNHLPMLGELMALEMSAEEFERLVIDELDQLPDDMVDGLENVVFVVEDRPEDGSLDVLGTYDGVALTERDRYGFGEMPDRILVFREPLLAMCEDAEELRDEVHVTLVHEIAHYYGIDDDRLHQLGWA